ncbi:Hypothetical predicted protein, partial [Olea europaea subsp. europaea]
GLIWRDSENERWRFESTTSYATATAPAPAPAVDCDAAVPTAMDGHALPGNGNAAADDL